LLRAMAQQLSVWMLLLLMQMAAGLLLLTRGKL
jgi:hypothetical protein